LGYSPLRRVWETSTQLRALLGFVLLTVAFSWPLPLHLGSHFTGSPDGDTGIYVWNQWLFRHELLSGQNSPLFTREIFSLSRPANLGLHNYTLFQDLLAVPLLPIFGVVATFNLVYLAVIVLTGYTAFRLAWHVTGRPFESWLAGALFSWSPMLVTRGQGHFSLVAAAPLAVFTLLLLKRGDQKIWQGALALGATICWAATTDPYYAIYCLVIAIVFITATTVTIADDVRNAPDRVVRGIDVLLACIGGLIVALLIGKGWRFTVLGLTMNVHGLYTPVLLLTLVTFARVAWTHRHLTVTVDRGRAVGLLRFASVAGLISAAMLSPVLYAVGVRIRDAGLESTAILWRSSPPGVDVMSFLLPNPNHPFAPAALRAWLSPRPDAYLENVASLTLVALVTIVAAIRCGWRPSRFWIAMAVAFGLLSLGPFVRLGGLDTHVPGPWALARYVPIVSLARSPARLDIVLMLAVSVLFAAALAWLANRSPRHRRRLLATVSVALLFELLPVPRILYSANIPGFYGRIAADPRDVRVLELPFGVRDGTRSVGNFSARSQYFQTMHEKRLIGGYLSRISERRISEFQREDMLNALMTLSEGGAIDREKERALIDGGPSFVERAGIGFVVIDAERSPAHLQDFAMRALHLERVDGEGALTLYVPRTPSAYLPN